MLVKYCSKCPGRPYTKNKQVRTCPRCGSELGMESVDEYDIADRPQLDIPFESEEAIPEDTSFGGTSYESNWDSGAYGASQSQSNGNGDLIPADDNDVSIPTTRITRAVRPKDSQMYETTIRGKVLDYSSSGNEDGKYRRYFPQKIYQAIVYGQRTEDVLHRFKVRTEQGANELGNELPEDVNVNVHGTISSGMHIANNDIVEVHGKYENNVLMASKIYIINNGYSSKVRFQRNVSLIVNTILMSLMACILLYIGITSGSAFLDTIVQFCKVWGIAAAVLTVMYGIASITKIGLLLRVLSTEKKKFPLVGILVISFVLAFLFIAAFGSLAGFGSYLTGLAMSVLPIVIIVIAIIFLIKAVIGA